MNRYNVILAVFALSSGDLGAATVRMSLFGTVSGVTNSAITPVPPVSVGTPWVMDIHYEHPTPPEFVFIEGPSWNLPLIETTLRVGSIYWSVQSIAINTNIAFNDYRLNAQMGEFTPRGIPGQDISFTMFVSSPRNFLPDVSSLPDSTADWNFLDNSSFRLGGGIGTNQEQWSFVANRLDSFTITIVPEPAGPALLVVVLLAGTSRRRQRTRTVEISHESEMRLVAGSGG